MRKINLKCCNQDSFKYSVLASLYYYDINSHLERITKLKPYISKYNFTRNTPNKFEINNPNVSLSVFDENNKIIYTSNNNSNNKPMIIKINNYRYAAIKPPRDKFRKLNDLLRSYSHSELKEFILQKIVVT